MSDVERLIAALDQGKFDAEMDGLLGSVDKAGLTRLMQEMDAQAASIADQDKRHLFKNGIGAIKMTLDSM